MIYGSDGFERTRMAGNARLPTDFKDHSRRRLPTAAATFLRPQM